MDYLKDPNTPPVLRRLYPMILLASTSGMRVGEILGLPVKNVNFAKHKVNVTQNLQYISGAGLVVLPPKTVAGIRSIKLPPAIMAALKPLCRFKLPDAYVFTTTLGTPFTSTNIRKYWIRILSDVNLPYKKFHVLRHSHATHLLSQGTPILEGFKRLGHSRASHTLDLYGHAAPRADEKIACQIEEMYIK